MSGCVFGFASKVILFQVFGKKMFMIIYLVSKQLDYLILVLQVAANAFHFKDAVIRF